MPTQLNLLFVMGFCFFLAACKFRGDKSNIKDNGLRSKEYFKPVYELKEGFKITNPSILYFYNGIEGAEQDSPQCFARHEITEETKPFKEGEYLIAARSFDEVLKQEF